MDKFDEKLYHLLGEYFPEYKEKSLSKKAKRYYITNLELYLGKEPEWNREIYQRLIGDGVEEGFANALSSIRDEWELTDLDEE
jgi:hypothetical protein